MSRSLSKSDADRPLAVLCAGMAFVTVAVYFAHAPALDARALAVDDHQYLVNNTRVRHPSPKAAWKFLSEVRNPSTVGGYYQPLTMISLMLDTAMGGDVTNLRVYHRTSLVLHIANTLLIIFLLHHLFGSPLIAVCVGLLFGVHPMTVEPIPWIGERKTLLASFFALISTIAYVRFTHRIFSPKSRIQNPKSGFWYLASLGCYALALLSKPTSTMLPFAFVLMDIWPLERFSRRTILEKIPLFCIGGLSAIITYLSQASTFVETPAQLGPLRIPLVICHNIFFYLYKILWPVSLSAFYPFPQPFSPASPMVLAGILGSIVLIIALLILWHRGIQPPLIAWLIFIVMILPTLGIVGFTVVIASDKYAYLPAIGLLMLITWAAKSITQRRPQFKIAIAFLALIIAALETRSTRAYLEEWQTTERLYRHMIVLAPAQPALHFALGHHYQFEGRPAEAQKEYEDALAIDPTRMDARLNLAGILVDQGNITAAMKHYDQMLAMRPDDVEALNNRGLALDAAGNFEAARQDFARAIQSRPEYAQAHNNLGLTLGKLGHLDEAVTELQTAIRLQEYFPQAWKNLAAAYWRMGRMQDAISAYQSLFRIDPDDADAALLLARAWKSVGQMNNAASVIQEYLARHPENSEVAGEWKNLSQPAKP